jgi:hypothetical protein
MQTNHQGIRVPVKKRCPRKSFKHIAGTDNVPFMKNIQSLFFTRGAGQIGHSSIDDPLYHSYRLKPNKYLILLGCIPII